MHHYFNNGIVWLERGLLWLSPWLFLLGCPLAAYGIWYQSEPLSVGLYVLAALLALTSLFSSRLRPLLCQPRHYPALLILLAIALWSLLMAPLQPIANRSLYGTPEIGEGAFSFLAIFLLGARLLRHWDKTWFRLGLLLSAASAAWVMAGLNLLLEPGDGWRPARWADHGGFVGIYLLILAMMILRHLPGWQGKPIRVMAAAYALGVLPILASESWAAIILYFVLVPLGYFAFGLLHYWRWNKAFLPYLLILLAPLCASAAMIKLIEFKKLATISSRGSLNQIGWNALADNFSLWFHGNGWGSYNDILFQYAYSTGARNFVNNQWGPNWEGLGAGAFHSHNQLLESILSLGLVGGLLFLALPLFIVWQSPRRWRSVIAVNWAAILVLQSSWFHLSLALPFYVAAMIACIAPCWSGATSYFDKQRPIHRLAPLIARLLAGMLAACLLIAAINSYQQAQRGHELMRRMNGPPPIDIAMIEPYLHDGRRGGTHLWWAMTSFNQAALLAVQGKVISNHFDITPEAASWYGIIFRAIDRLNFEPGFGLRVRGLAMSLRSDLMFYYGHTSVRHLQQEMQADWQRLLLALLRDAPQRGDMAVPLFMHLSQQKDFAAIEKLANQILIINPQDAVASWHKGIAWSQQPDRAEAGLCLMIRAYQQGADRFMPIPNGFRQQVSAANGRFSGCR